MSCPGRRHLRPAAWRRVLNLNKAQNPEACPPVVCVCCQVCELLTGRVVVGHSLNKDLKVLLLSHPRKDIRDTARWARGSNAVAGLYEDCFLCREGLVRSSDAGGDVEAAMAL